MTRPDIVTAARRWLGTPYVHQASSLGHGCDCLGLLRGVWREVMGGEPEKPPRYSMDWDEVARRELLRDAARRHLRERPRHRLAEGDVILFRMRADAVAKHLGLFSGGTVPRFIHAYSGRGVVETALTEPWRRRIDSVFSFPGID